MERYEVSPLGNGRWRIDDKLTGFSIEWREGDFNATQEVSLPPKLTETQVRDAPGIMSAMGDWLAKNHAALCSTTPEQRRKEMGQRIRELRQERGMTIEQLALRSGVTPNNLSRIEHGKHSFNYDTLARIVAVFGKKIILQ